MAASLSGRGRRLGSDDPANAAEVARQPRRDDVALLEALVARATRPSRLGSAPTRRRRRRRSSGASSSSPNVRSRRIGPVTSTAVRQSAAAMTTTATPSTTRDCTLRRTGPRRTRPRRGATARRRRGTAPTTDDERQADEQRHGRIRSPAGRPEARVRDTHAAPAAAVRAPRLRVRLDAHGKRAARAGRDAERRAVREQPVPELDLERRVRREDGVLGELGADAEPARRGLQSRRRLTLRVALPDPAEERDAADERPSRPRPSSHAAQTSERRDRRRAREHREDGSSDGVAREPARLRVARRPRTRTRGASASDSCCGPGRERLGRARRRRARPGRGGRGRVARTPSAARRPSDGAERRTRPGRAARCRRRCARRDR